MAYSAIPREITTGTDLIGTTPIQLPDGSVAELEHTDGPEPIWLTLFSSMFMHGGWAHLGGNMLFLFIFGDNVEARMGKMNYLIFYLLSGVAAALLQSFLLPASQVPMIGASGAIAGVMGAYMVKFPHSRIVTLVPLFVFLTTIEIPAYLILIYWFVIQFFSGIGSVGHSQLSEGGVAWFAHIGGFVAGIVLILMMKTRSRYRRRSDLNW